MTALVDYITGLPPVAQAILFLGVGAALCIACVLREKL